MKKYKLQDLVANGSHSRLKVDSDLLVGDINNGYGYGDVLDANATKDVATGIAEDKVNTAKLELMDIIRGIEGSSDLSYVDILELIDSIKDKNILLDEQDVAILQQIEDLIARILSNKPTVGGDNDNLIFNIN